jgi:hypothetical protein
MGYALRLFSLDEFVRANKEKNNLIGWRQILTTSTPNRIHALLVRAKEILCGIATCFSQN